MTGSPAVGGGESSVGPVYRDSVDGSPRPEYRTHRGEASLARGPIRAVRQKLQRLFVARAHHEGGRATARPALLA